MLVPRRIAVAHQTAYIVELFTDQRLLLAPITLHGVIGLNQPLLPLNSFTECLHISLQSGPPRPKQLLLRRQDLLNLRVCAGLLQVFMEADRCEAFLLSQQSALHGAQAQVALPHGFVDCAHRSLVQTYQQLPLLDLIPLAHQHFPNDTASEVLNRLALGVDGHHTLPGNALIQRRKACPQQKAPKA